MSNTKRGIVSISNVSNEEGCISVKVTVQDFSKTRGPNATWGGVEYEMFNVSSADAVTRGRGKLNADDFQAIIAKAARWYFGTGKLRQDKTADRPVYWVI